MNRLRLAPLALSSFVKMTHSIFIRLDSTITWRTEKCICWLIIAICLPICFVNFNSFPSTNKLTQRPLSYLFYLGVVDYTNRWVNTNPNRLWRREHFYKNNGRPQEDETKQNSIFYSTNVRKYACVQALILDTISERI